MLHLIAFGIAVLFFITCGLMLAYYTLGAIILALVRVLVVAVPAMGFVLNASLFVMFVALIAWGVLH
jgi:hypothetical protein